MRPNTPETVFRVNMRALIAAILAAALCADAAGIVKADLIARLGFHIRHSLTSLRCPFYHNRRVLAREKAVF